MPSNSVEKLPESLRARPPTETTVGERKSPSPGGSAAAAAIVSTEPGVIRSHRRRRRTASDPISPATMATATPELGQHTDEVLAEAGYSGAEIAALRKNKVI